MSEDVFVRFEMTAEIIRCLRLRDVEEYLVNNMREEVCVRFEMTAEIIRSLRRRHVGISVEEYEAFQSGTRIFTVEENLEAFSQGEGMKHMPFAAQKMNDFMVDVGFIEAGPEDLGTILDDSFVKAYAEGL